MYRYIIYISNFIETFIYREFNKESKAIEKFKEVSDQSELSWTLRRIDVNNNISVYENDKWIGVK